MKHVLEQKRFIYWQDMDLLLQARFEEKKNCSWSVKTLGIADCKEGHADSFLGHKRTCHNFLKKVQLKTVLPVANSWGKIHIIYWWPS